MRAKTHDLTQRSFGHDYWFEPLDGGRRGRMGGWHPYRINRRDFVLLNNGGRSTRYRVVSVDRPSDPPDQWFADVEFAPRRAADRARKGT